MKKLILLLLLCFPCANINWAQLEIDANRAVKEAAATTDSKYNFTEEAALTDFDLAGFEKELRETLKQNRERLERIYRPILRPN